MKILIFIPGLGGSLLEDSETGKIFYPGNIVEYLLNNYDKKKFEELYNCKSIKSTKILSSFAGVSIYKRFKQLLRNNYNIVDHLSVDTIYDGTKDIAIMLPWPWIYGIEKGVEALYEMIQNIHNTFEEIYNTKKTTVFLDGIILVGHSAGGIVANLYHYRYNLIKILRIVTIGTPFFGTDKALKVLTLNSKKNEMSWFTSEQIFKLANHEDFFILYDLLPKINNPVKHLDFTKVTRSNNLKDEIIRSLKQKSANNTTSRIYIYNIKKAIDGKQTLSTTAHNNSLEISSYDPRGRDMSTIFPKLGDGVVDSAFINEPNTTTYYINTSESHKFLLNYRGLMEILKAPLR